MAKKPLVDVFTSFFKRGVVSSMWSSSTAYVAGQYAIYQNYIYKCIKNATAGTLPTDTTYWAKTDLASEITSLNSNIKNLNIKGTKELLGTLTTLSGVVTINKNISNYKYIVIEITQAYRNCVLCVPTWLLSIVNTYSFSFGKPVEEFGAQGIIIFEFPSNQDSFKVGFTENWSGGWTFVEWDIYGIN